MEALIICSIVTAIVVYVWDYVRFPQEVANLMMRKISNGKIVQAELRKPFGCSLCMTTWITLVILLVMNWRLAPLCLVFGFSTKFILYVITIIDELFTGVLLLIEKVVTKLNEITL